MIDIKKVVEITKEAGSVAMEFYESPGTEIKSDNSPITKADKASEMILLNKLKQFGDLGFFSEETEDDKTRLKKEYVWIIDPIDGTADFIQKTGEFAVMVGLVKNGEPVLGVVYLPAIEKMYFAQKEKGAFMQEKSRAVKKIFVSETSNINEARLVVSRNHLSELDKSIAEDIGSGNFIKTGCNGVKICKIAEGSAELFFNTASGLGEEDCCAPQIILAEAGGKVTGTDGNDIIYNKQTPRLNTGIAASNSRLHNKLIENILKKK